MGPSISPGTVSLPHRYRPQVSICVIFCFEEGITQCYRLNPLHVDVSCKLRIYVEEDGHVYRLASIQSLLLEAETLDFAEVWRDLPGCDRVCGNANDIFGRLIRSCVECESRFAG